MNLVIKPDSLSTRVRNAYEEAGRDWSLERTIRACREQDMILEREGLNPAPAFRKNRDVKWYVRKWVHSCRFEWLR